MKAPTFDLLYQEFQLQLNLLKEFGAQVEPVFQRRGLSNEGSNSPKCLWLWYTTNTKTTAAATPAAVTTQQDESRCFMQRSPQKIWMVSDQGHPAPSNTWRQQLVAGLLVSEQFGGGRNQFVSPNHTFLMVFMEGFGRFPKFETGLGEHLHGHDVEKVTHTAHWRRTR